MRAGTPGFVPERLVEAREARGITTQLALANLIGKPRSTVSRWETGEATPEPETLDTLAAQLNVRRSYFLRPIQATGQGAFFARARKSVEKGVQSAVRARLRWTADISGALQHYFDFPDYDIPDSLRSISYKSLRDEDIEDIATILRTHWQLGEGPISSMISVLEAHGFVVARDEVGSGRLDGLCHWSEADGRPYILLATDKQSFFRSQMDAAHEMGHAILHRYVDQATFERDFDLIETQAFRLASAFLMPAKTFSLEARYPTLNGLLSMKERWRVSIKAMIKRCTDLGIITDTTSTQLYKHYSAKGWNRGEPLDREFPEDPPKLLARAIKELVETGERSKNELLENEFIIPASDIETLTSLPRGWLRSDGDVVSFPLQRRAAKPTEGEVINLFGWHQSKR